MIFVYKLIIEIIFFSFTAIIFIISAIEYFLNKGILESLPLELQSAAKLRIDNPNASLKELCKISTTPITVSGLNHRLSRIIDLYNNAKK